MRKTLSRILASTSKLQPEPPPPPMPVTRWNGDNIAGHFADRGFIDYVRNGGHMAVEGWLTDGAMTVMTIAHAVQRGLGVTGDIAEIGVHHGRFFIALALTCAGDERAMAIDVFDDQHLNIDQSGHGDRKIFEANVRAHGVPKERLIVHKGDSLAMRPRDFPSGMAGRVRLFSVDGGHTLQHVLNDMALAESVLSEAGVVILDDFFNPSWPEVTEGYLRYAAESRALAPFAYGDNKLFLCREAYHATFMEAMRRMVVQKTPNHKRVLIGGEACWWVTAPHVGGYLVTPEFKLGEPLVMSLAGVGPMYRGQGWSYVEPWGCWTVGGESFLYLPLVDPLVGGRLRIVVSGHASVRDGAPRQCNVSLNERVLGTASFTTEASHATFETEAPVDAGELVLRLAFPDVFAPRDITDSRDERELGLAVYRILIEQV
jgi:hypothetical protein